MKTVPYLKEFTRFSGKGAITVRMITAQHLLRNVRRHAGFWQAAPEVNHVKKMNGAAYRIVSVGVQILPTKNVSWSRYAMQQVVTF